MAAAFIAYDNSTEYAIDETYGELVFMYYFWGEQENGEYEEGRKVINSTHNCTREELALEGDS